MRAGQCGVNPSSALIWVDIQGFRRLLPTLRKTTRLPQVPWRPVFATRTLRTPEPCTAIHRASSMRLSGHLSACESRVWPGVDGRSSSSIRLPGETLAQRLHGASSQLAVMPREPSTNQAPPSC